MWLVIGEEGIKNLGLGWRLYGDAHSGGVMVSAGRAT
jgi:hypothetical protein